MAPGNESFEAMMAELRQEFLDRLKADTPAIEAAWAEVQVPETRRHGLETLASLSHKLAGLGRTFGYPEVTDCGLAVERAAEGLLREDGAGDTPAQFAEKITVLRSALSAASGTS